MTDLDLVVFDMAGTTVQDHGEVPDSFRAALAEHGLEVTDEQLSAVRGSSKRQAVLDLIPDGPDKAQHAGSIYDTFCQRLAQRYRDDGVYAVEGAEHVFRQLRAAGVRVALNTGFDRDITTLLLTALGWADGVVDAVISGDDVAQGRPAPYLIFRAMEATRTTSVHRVANVGDTALDLQAGHNAGVRWNIGVLSGAHSRRILEQAPHTQLLPSVAELLTLWSSMTE
jgi:phosphonatase-like hydrolase